MKNNRIILMNECRRRYYTPPISGRQDSAAFPGQFRGRVDPSSDSCDLSAFDREALRMKRHCSRVHGPMAILIQCYRAEIA